MATTFKVYGEPGASQLVLDALEYLHEDMQGTPVATGMVSELPPVAAGSTRVVHRMPCGDVVLIDTRADTEACMALYWVRSLVRGDYAPYWREVRQNTGRGLRAECRGDRLLLCDDSVGMCWHYDFERRRICEMRMEPATEDDVEYGIRWYAPDPDGEVLHDWAQWKDYDGRSAHNSILARDAANMGLRYYVQKRHGHPKGDRRFYLGRTVDGYALLPLDEFPEPEWSYAPMGYGGVLLREGRRENCCEAAFYVWSNGRHRWARVSHASRRVPFCESDCEWDIYLLNGVIVVLNSAEGQIYLYNVAEKFRAVLSVPPTSGRHVPYWVHADRVLTWWHSDPDGYDHDDERREYVIRWEDWIGFGEPAGDVPIPWH